MQSPITKTARRSSPVANPPLQVEDWIVRLFGNNKPLGFQAGDDNLYRYVDNDPTNAVDPSGLAAEALDPNAATAQLSITSIRITDQGKTFYKGLELGPVVGPNAFGFGFQVTIDGTGDITKGQYKQSICLLSTVEKNAGGWDSGAINHEHFGLLNSTPKPAPIDDGQYARYATWWLQSSAQFYNHTLPEITNATFFSPATPWALVVGGNSLQYADAPGFAGSDWGQN
jgi:hypothetical protein